MSELNMERMEELFDSEEFRKILKTASTTEDMIRIFAENGVEISTKDAEQFLHGRTEAMEKDELADDELDAVAGGKSKCFFHGIGDAAFGRSMESDSGFWYRLGYRYASRFCRS